MKENGWGKSSFLLDGFPRSIENWESWQEVIGDEATVIGVLHLECSEENMKKRIMHRGKTSGRTDDTEEVLVERFRVNKELTTPILELFTEKGKLFSLDANGTPEEVQKAGQELLDGMGIFQKSFKEANFEIRSYLKNKVDAFVKPLMTDIMREKPEDVHAFMLEWITSKGADIKDAQS